MSIPCYSDIAKKINDLLGKDYPVGVAKLEVNTLTDSGLKFTVTGSKDNKSGGIVSDLKVKYQKDALIITESWSTLNVLGVQVESQDQLAKGVKLDLVASLLPEKGTRNLRSTVEMQHKHVFARAALDLFKGPAIVADVVLGQSGYLLGAETAYDVAEAKVTKYSAALAYACPQYTVSLQSLNKLSLFSVAYYHKVNALTEAGAKATWQRGDQQVSLELGSKYVIDKDAFVKAKIDNVGRLGLGYSQVLSKGIKVGFGGVFDTARLSNDAHKLGFSLAFEA